MNIFFLDPDPVVTAAQHCDKHVTKMILEYGQLLSTAHRYHDGHTATIMLNNKPRQVLLLGDEVPSVKYADTKQEDGTIRRREKLEIKNGLCYLATHSKHPSAMWARETNLNYNWLNDLFVGCLHEFEKRYHKKHMAWRIANFLATPPKNIPTGPLTAFPQAMPDKFKIPDDSIAAYRGFYLGEKIRFTRWTNTTPPEWFINNLPEGFHATNFTRTT